MTHDALARTLAAALGVIGVIDPAWRTPSSWPRAVELRVADGTDASAVRTRLERAVNGDVTFSSSDVPAARVIIGDVPLPPVDATPTSFVSLATGAAPNTRIVAVSDPAPALPGWRTSIAVDIEGHGVANATSTIVLEHSGVELGRTEYTWRGADERASVRIPFVPPADGTARLSIRVLPLDAEQAHADNSADVRAVARARRLRVLVHEARPSWTAAFVRRVLEANPAFDVSASVAASRGLRVNAGTPPPRLHQLDGFETVLVGAPEELTSGDVDALESFARRRGGAVVLLPDRRPSGPYLRLLRAREFDEVLVEKPVAAQGENGVLRAGELVLPRGSVDAADVLAAIDREGSPKAVVFGVALGAGRVVFSGAMDAWRFRAADDGGFVRFWTSTVAGLALAAPPALDITTEPGIVKTGDSVGVRVRLRRSELNEAEGRIEVPAVQARLIAASGRQQPIRLWPGAGPGLFEGRVTIPEAGRFDVSASSGAHAADTVLIADADVRRPEQADARRHAIAAATGGVVVSARELDPLVRSLRGLPAPGGVREARPARSVWFVAAFAALLCGEWTMRRRAGRR